MSDARLCVYCRQQPEAHGWRPFCSERCRMADLGRWLTGAYRVPSRTNDDDEAADAAERPIEERDDE